MRGAGRRRWLWPVSIVVVLLGAFAGGALYAVGHAMWFSFQPKSYVLDWTVPTILGLIGGVWLAAIFQLARLHRGRARWIFLGLALTAGAASFAADLIPGPREGEVFYETLSPGQAEIWSNLAK